MYIIYTYKNKIIYNNVRHKISLYLVSISHQKQKKNNLIFLTIFFLLIEIESSLSHNSQKIIIMAVL